MRFVGLFLILTIVGAACFVYDVKYQSSRLARQSMDLEQSIQKEKDTLGALRAEWSALNQPARMQFLAARHLPTYKNLTVKQMALAYELPERPMDLGSFIGGLDVQPVPALSPPEKAVAIARSEPKAEPLPPITRVKQPVSIKTTVTASIPAPKAQRVVSAPMVLTPVSFR